MWILCNDKQTIINIETGASIKVTQKYKSSNFEVRFNSAPTGYLSGEGFINAQYSIDEFDTENKARARLHEIWNQIQNKGQGIQ